MIFSSLYTGALFQFMQSNDSEKEAQSIEEMAERDYKFYLIASYDDMTINSVPMKGRQVLQNSKITKVLQSSISRRVIITPNDLKVIMNKTLDVEFKGALMITLSQVLYKNQVNQKSFHYQVCKEFYSMVPVVIYFPKNNYLVESINRKLEAFSTAGLIEYWASFHMDMKYLNFKWTNQGPKKMTLDHLSGTFQILVVGLVVSIALFLLEVSWFRVQSWKILKKTRRRT
jgi:hypothetical protein